MGNGFRLDASKHIDKKRTKVAETWGIVDKNEEGIGEIALTQNIGQAFEVWETNAKDTSDMERALQEMKTRSALQEEELNANKTKEIADLKNKAVVKNWSDDKLADKLAKVEQKYENLRKKRLALVEKEEKRIRQKNQDAHQKVLDARADNIDKLLNFQEKEGLLEINLKSTSEIAYGQPKTSEEKVDKM